MTCTCAAGDRTRCDISVAIGDTIGANNVPGRWVTVYSGCTVKSETMPRRGIWYCRPENDPDGGVTVIYFTAIVCNYTTGEGMGCSPARSI